MYFWPDFHGWIRRVCLATFLQTTVLWSATTVTLDTDHPVELRLSPGETKSLAVPVGAGQFIRIASEADDQLAVKTTLFDADGRRLATAPSLGGTGGIAIVAAYAVAKTEMRLDVQSVSFLPDRICRVSVLTLTAASEQDRIDARAHETFARVAGMPATNAAQLRAIVQALDEPLQLARQAGDSLLEVRALFGKGQFLATAGDVRESLPWFEQTLSAAEKFGEQRALAHVLSVIGLAKTNLEEHESALDFYLRALAIQRSLKQSWETALTLDNLAESEASLGRLDLSLQYLQQETELRKEIKDELGLNQNLVSLGDIYLALGESGKALTALLATLPHWAKLKDREFESRTWNKLGRCYLRLGEYELAIKALQRGLRLQQNEAQLKVRTDLLVSLGEVESAQQRSGARSTFGEALRLARSSEYRHAQAQALEGLATLDAKATNQKSALQELQEALSLSVEIKQRDDEARIRRRLGLLQNALGKTTEGMQELEQAIRIQSEIGDRQGEIEALLALANLKVQSGGLADAVELLERARRLVERSRSAVFDSALRSSYLASQRRVYELTASVLTQLDAKFPERGYGEKAFQVSEQAHARVLLDAVETATPQNGELLVRARALDAAIRVAVSGSVAGNYRASIPLPKLVAQRDDLEERLGAGQVREPEALSDLRRDLLLGNAVLLEYLVGSEGSHLWIVTPTVLKHFSLPAERVLQTSTRSLYASVTARNQVLAGESLEARQRRLAEVDRTSELEAAALGRLLLPRGLSLPRNAPLLIVTDGALGYVPFAALPFAANRFLAQSHCIVEMPSASIVARVRTEARAIGKRALIIGDPVYDTADPRVESHRARDGQPEMALDRLVRSRKEVESIESFLGAGRHEAMLDFYASPTLFRRPEISHFSLIHIAAHALVDGRDPEQTGIALSMVNERGQKQEGFLRVRDIYQTRLQAELVTLSGCETVLGKEVRGEGLMGLSRAFLYVGARRVLGSLWSVDDQATSAFMKHFYKALLRDNTSPPVALREAQQQIRNDTRWSAPYYWAAFALQGDWR
jgi:CHAT domain-containing protein/tetratricopeptide (TPR) repeat protein